VLLSFGSRKQLSEIFFPLGRYKSETINLLVLEEPKDSSNVAFLGPMKFIGVGCRYYPQLLRFLWGLPTENLC